MFPALIAFVLLVVLAGRQMSARNQVEGAARAGARAASQARSSGEAVMRARTVAIGTITANGTECDGGPRISVDTDAWSAGGAVSVTVRCSVRVVDLGVIGLAGNRSVSASATEAVDVYRATG